MREIERGFTIPPFDVLGENIVETLVTDKNIDVPIANRNVLVAVAVAVAGGTVAKGMVIQR